MSHADFVHLRVHSAYSLAEGALRIGKLIDQCRAEAMPAVAITDTGNLFGALEFSLAARKGGIQPIVGTILHIAREDAADGRALEPDPIVLLAQDEAGYGNLIKLSSMAFLETAGNLTPQVRLADLEGRGDGVIALSGGAAGPVGRLLREGREAQAEALLCQMAAIFPGRLYVEIQRHGLPDEAQCEPGLLDLAYRLDLPLVATNDVFFADAGMYEAHDALLCIAEGTYVDQENRRRLTPDHRFKSAVEMRETFADLPEASDNTLVIARRCAFAVPERAPIMPIFEVDAGQDQAGELRAQAEAGLDERLRDHVFTPDMDEMGRVAAAGPYRDKLLFELDVIITMGFAGYFLIVADFIQYAKKHGIPVGPGRGSGAGSVAAWALKITDLDPLRFGLVFERFLNPERVSMPDFDIDFCQDRRDEVIRYVVGRYGADRVAQIITFGKLQARAVLRDVGRVLQMPYGQVDRLCKMVPNNPANPVTLPQAIAGEPRLQQERDADPQVARLIEIATKLEGLYRHASTHAAGVVIGDRPLDELIPLYRDPRSEMPVTQFSMKYAEAAGLIKFDFLGLKTLTVLERARALVAARGIEIDYLKLPLDDPAPYEMLASGETVGVFQFESPGMRDLLREAQPNCIEDLIALVALFRPGPMENIPKYVACKHGREQPEVLHELIEPVVADTYGVIIYQEQVMKIAQVFADYTLGEADLLRRAMGKKIKAEMEAQRERFVQGAMTKGVARDRAIHVFNLVDKFAGYGFNKAHSAGYALVAYQTAWMKAHYPVEYFAAMMTLDLGNTDKLNVYRRELERLGIPLRHPDINRSGADFTVELGEDGQGAIRYALCAIRNVGRPAMDAIIAERDRGGPFAGVADFATRVDPRALNKRQLENLIAAGALDSLGEERSRLFAGAETVLKFAASATNDRESQQESLFGGADTVARGFALPMASTWPPMEKLSREFDAIGFYLSAHPLDAYARELRRMGVLRMTDVTGRLTGEPTRYTVAGTVLAVQERRSQRGNRFARVQLSDTSRSYEVTAFSEVLAAAGDLLAPGTSVVLVVEAHIEGEFERYTVQSVHSLEKMAAETDAGLCITVAEQGAVAELGGILRSAGRGRGPVNLRLRLDDAETEVEVALGSRFAISPLVRQRIEALAGVREVQEL